MRYSPLVIDHVKNPRNVGEIPGANAKARVRSSGDGDMLQIHLLIEDDQIKDAKFKVFGCGAAIASGSILTELIIGKTLEQLKDISNQKLSEIMGGLPPGKIQCSVLAEQAIEEALTDYKAREKQ